MTTNNMSPNKGDAALDQNEGGATLADRASDLKDRASGLLQEGIDYVKNNPGKTAAVVGGVAAAAAAYATKDKIAGTASGLRDKVNEKRSSNESGKKSDRNNKQKA